MLSTKAVAAQGISFKNEHIFQRSDTHLGVLAINVATRVSNHVTLHAISLFFHEFAAAGISSYSLTTNGNIENIGLITDGDLLTQWEIGSDYHDTPNTWAQVNKP